MTIVLSAIVSILTLVIIVLLLRIRTLRKGKEEQLKLIEHLKMRISELTDYVITLEDECNRREQKDANKKNGVYNAIYKNQMLLYVKEQLLKGKKISDIAKDADMSVSTIRRWAKGLPTN